MALKQSPLNKEVKIPSLCQMCDESSNIKWMCMECNLFFCAECEFKFHKKSKTLAGHYKIDIEQCGTENITKAIHKAGLRNLNCEVHSDLICVLFCQDCQQPVCTNCVLASSHEEHKLFAISDVYEEKFCEMEDFQKGVQQDILFCSQVQSELKHMLDGGRKQHTKNKQILLQLEEDVITKTQKYAKKNLAIADSEWKTLEGLLKQEIKVLKTLRDQMEAEREIISHGSSASDILSKLYPSSKNMHSPKKSVYQMVLKQISYNPKYGITQHTIEQIIKDFLQQKKGPTFQTIKSFKTKLKSVSKVLLLDNNQALIASEKDKIVQKIQFDNEDIKVLKTLPETTVYDMAKLHNGDILISVQESQLNIFREKNDTIELFYSFSPLKTFGIHVNKENEILVGISAGFPDEEDKITKPGKIVVLNSEGIVKRTYEYDKKTHSKECLCTCPTKIVTNLDNTICFIDKLTKNNKGRIVNLDQEGKLMWTYDDKYYGLSPDEIAIMNSAGCILVTSFSCFYEFLILSKYGSVIVKSSGFSRSNISGMSISINKEMKIYAGEKKTKDTWWPYVKIHIVDI